MGKIRGTPCMRSHIFVHLATTKYFSNSFVFKTEIEKEGLPGDITPATGAERHKFKSCRPDQYSYQIQTGNRGPSLRSGFRLAAQLLACPERGSIATASNGPAKRLNLDNVHAQLKIIASLFACSPSRSKARRTAAKDSDRGKMS